MIMNRNIQQHIENYDFWKLIKELYGNSVCQPRFRTLMSLTTYEDMGPNLRSTDVTDCTERVFLKMKHNIQERAHELRYTHT